MIKNIYYIVNTDDINIEEILKLSFGEPSTQRYSNDGTKVLIKLPLDDKNDYEILQNYQKHTHLEILDILNSTDIF